MYYPATDWGLWFVFLFINIWSFQIVCHLPEGRRLHDNFFNSAQNPMSFLSESNQWVITEPQVIFASNQIIENRVNHLMILSSPDFIMTRAMLFPPSPSPNGFICCFFRNGCNGINSWILDISSNTASSYSRFRLTWSLFFFYLSGDLLLSNSVGVYIFHTCTCVCVSLCEILDLPEISLVSDKTNFLVSEVGEWLLGSSTFFLFFWLWQGVGVPDAAYGRNVVGALWELCFLRGYVDYPKPLEFHLFVA